MPHRDAITDVRGILVGHWTDRRAATGCTVVLCPAGTVGGVDVRGAAPGTRETDLLKPGNLVEEVHAIVLSGGSAFGLEAATGVMEELAARDIGLRFHRRTIPIVPAAIVFDLGIGRPRHPDAEAGRRATKRAKGGRVEVGSVGAGTGATVAKWGGIERALKGGIGTASELLDTGVVIGAIAVVNAVGNVRDPASGEVIAAPRDDRAGEFVDIESVIRFGRNVRGDEVAAKEGVEAPAHTTLVVVATNAKLNKTQTNRVATVAHDGLAAAIWPVHTRADGDVVFALATGEHEVDATGYTAVEAFAVRAVERAILDAVRSAETLGGVPSAGEWRSKRGGRRGSR